MIKKHTISLIIPCKNEENSLGALLSKVPSYVDEVIVVDNNSTDKTAQVAKKYGAKVVTEKRTEHGIGYGYAHQSGIKKATGDILVTVDGDGTYPVYQIKEIVTHLLKEKADFVLCNRFPLTDSHAISWIRQLGVWVLNTETTILFGYPMKDILSGMWAVRKPTARKMKLVSGGWNLSPEIKLAALTDPTIASGEFHINHHYRRGGESKQIIWKTGFEHLFYIFSLWLWRMNPLKMFINRHLMQLTPATLKAKFSFS